MAGQMRGQMAQRVEESSVVDPSPLLDLLLVHNGDLSRWAGEPDPPQLEPEP